MATVKVIALCTAQFIAIGTSVIAVIALVGHMVSGQDGMKSWGGDTNMAIPTAVCFILLSVAVFLLAEKLNDWMHTHE